MKSEVAQKILEQTKQTYDDIAADFDKTRQYLWPGMSSFKQYVKADDRVLDLGCGNGKLRLLFKDVNVDYLGVDNSSNQIEFAKSRSDFRVAHQKFVAAEVFQLPLADNSFNVVFCLAVLHHIPSTKLRLKTLTEIKRVLKPDGILIMSNWNRWQAQYLHYITKHTALKIIGQSELDFKDIFLPWMGGRAMRYYHAFTLGEIRGLIKKSGLKIDDNSLTYWGGKKASRFSYLKAANIVTIAKKC
ncbi:MAG: hypothetical protein A2731_02450 [Candidatus Buchananbacteria bacterium RIFCSPHIGHO2_01_FULL_39_8]|uniref:Methyltransferase domain-containing protein n=1 Tax=Candidatus Buchananbacteria bacterium RIFCSPHIGHO2_01_FULL_39_8 TaxID=1797533 RepID=A0A1G1XXF6_9BACT|nr:MAG: hypothetical protein A2731_02450 [Candidatus Buchananbacteria bacterium RIFCSPHIGHO2_01_FULL_39_8]